MNQDIPSDDETHADDSSSPGSETAPEGSEPTQKNEAESDTTTPPLEVVADTLSPDVFPFDGREPTPDREILGTLHRLGETVTERFEQIENLLRREARETSREKVIDRLHAELQEYKQDLLLSTLRPVFIDLIQLHDDIGKMAVVPAGAEGNDLTETRRLVSLMDGFQQGIEDILYRQGVEPFLVEGDVFDPRRQRAIATVATDDPALNKTVAARHRKGFQAGDRVIRAEIVSVYAVKKGRD